ncbi:hypothetical protein PENSPDRAFT_697946 [Peniophora sp. CONT]|nr:hypothetical protein PENSPDRAFT_697946 [Peniophora sp. CONT]
MASQPFPQLLDIPRDHALYLELAKKFQSSWKKKERKEIARIFLITWPRAMRTTFQDYRDRIATLRGTPKGFKDNEIKCFRSESRACRLGDTESATRLCEWADCRLCLAIKTGFEASLLYKQQRVWSGSRAGVRFGGGIYMSPDSDKAFEYAVDVDNAYNRSPYSAVLVTRTVLGNKQYLTSEDCTRLQPDPDYDSAYGFSAKDGRIEHIVYNKYAVRPAYLVMLKR